MMKHTIEQLVVICIALAILAFLGAALTLADARHLEHQKACESLGGIYMAIRGTELCFSKSALLYQ